ncbi:hypothetical protein [Streptomyces sp. NBC_01618]|uniref:hypothetical protein n=1 Tax=Streptomyces sp. NBC_01618 TaxID=2975900 RepID=UPI0038696391|nr:hypothetical protein OH735_17545 [Streptomyces sp. NBC_01618]
MRIELTWPRPDTDDRTLTLALPDLPALRHASRLWPPAVLLRAVSYAEPVVAATAIAVGAGPLTRAALPYVLRFARQALDTGEPAALASPIPHGSSSSSTPRPPAP